MSMPNGKYNYAKGANAHYSACTVVSAVEFAARQIGPICAWSSGNVARVMAEHIGGSLRLLELRLGDAR